MMKNEIEVDHVCFGYSQKDEILHDVSFKIAKDSFYGVIGPNGGGKSTLFKLLLGLIHPLTGKITIGGTVPNNAASAYVPQTFQFDPRFPITALEVVLGGRMRELSFWGKFSKEDYLIAHQKLHQVGLPHIGDQHFSSLSQGQAQRVFIARALASNSSILLLDEPTSSSDPSAQAATLSIIESLKGQMTILMVTHSISAILKNVDGILCVQGGTITMSPKDLCEHFALGLYHEPLVDIPHGHLKITQRPLP